MSDSKNRAWREVDLSALAHNAHILQTALAPGCRLMAVVKADAYGHGAIPTARRLEREGIRAFAVACLDEGIALRQAGIRGEILILGYTSPWEAEELIRWKLVQTVADELHGQALAARGLPVPVHLALDTGMHRLGIPAEDRAALVRLYGLAGLNIRGVFSHLCVSDSLQTQDLSFTQEQLKRFYGALQWLRAQGYAPGETHIQASYGIWNLPPQPCTWARAGIALYGVTSDGRPTRQALDLIPVLSLRARVASVRTLAPGEGAGYGLAFRAKDARRLATVTIGYADGLPRDLPHRGGAVLLAGQRCPMVGRMCMDQLLVDVTHAPHAAPGDVVTLMGRDGGQVISAENLARQCGTITNELLSRLSHRLPVVTAAFAAKPKKENLF
ncbi:serine racemase VanT catalytic subunit [Pseudoflavonifractor phocaeensis]|uniref:serine racemase VanT catalytic subunit n=1 Tax=Pseudoflavonifractor phocaeensis TaxID=1870988 RepID=UPI00195BF963|nr:serine racemase VanT catalytic subunit [Pseudoflavonifractor phocaeensis]MBM6925377.1 serine racemase VanT catalytic subunit [Pseudoflavonifractor phocaeensis]